MTARTAARSGDTGAVGGLLLPKSPDLAQLHTNQSLNRLEKQQPDLCWDTGARQGTTLSPPVPHCHQPLGIRRDTIPGTEDTALLPSPSLEFLLFIQYQHWFNYLRATRAAAVPATCPLPAQDTVPPLCPPHRAISQSLSPCHPQGPSPDPQPCWNGHSPLCPRSVTLSGCVTWGSVVPQGWGAPKPLQGPQGKVPHPS